MPTVAFAGSSPAPSATITDFGRDVKEYVLTLEVAPCSAHSIVLALEGVTIVAQRKVKKQVEKAARIEQQRVKGK